MMGHYIIYSMIIQYCYNIIYSIMYTIHVTGLYT